VNQGSADDERERSGREFLLAQLAPSDLLGICLDLMGAALVLGEAYYAAVRDELTETQ